MTRQTLLKCFISLAFIFLSSISYSFSISVSDQDQNMLYQIIEAEDQRLVDAPVLFEGLSHPSARIQIASLNALGHIGNPASVAKVKGHLSSIQPEIREAAAFSLGLLGGEEANQALLTQLAHEEIPSVLQVICTALGKTGTKDTTAVFSQILLYHTSSKTLAGASHGLGLLWMNAAADWPIPDELLNRLTDLLVMKDVGIEAAFALSRFRGDSSLLPTQKLIETFKAFHSISDNSIKALLVRTLGKIKTNEVAKLLTDSLLHDAWWGVRVEAARALASRSPNNQILMAFRQSLLDPSHQVVNEVLTSIAKTGSNSLPLFSDVEHLFRSNASLWIKSSALDTLSKIDLAKAEPLILESLSSPSPLLKLGAIRLLGDLAKNDYVPMILDFIKNDYIKIKMASIEALSKLPQDLIPESSSSLLIETLNVRDSVLTAQIADYASSHKLTSFAPHIINAYTHHTKPDDLEARLGILTALQTIGSVEEASAIEPSLYANDRIEVVTAVQTYKILTGNDMSHLIPIASHITNMPTPPLEELERACHSSIRLTTSRGIIEIKMLQEAPVISAYFLRLVQKEFYNNLTFHRVVPNFVVQGGDPRGDGYGGPGYLLRDDYSVGHHDRGFVGMATAGKDTAGSQFFINHAPNLHLDWQYAIFAQVTVGMDVVDQLEIGDSIIQVEVVKMADAK